MPTTIVLFNKRVYIVIWRRYYKNIFKVHRFSISHLLSIDIAIYNLPGIFISVYKKNQ